MTLAAIGTIIGGVSSAIQLSYQAAIARANQQQQKLNAEAAAEQAQMDIQDLGTQRRGELGELRSSQAASGLGIRSPSFASGEAAFEAKAIEEAHRLQYSGNQQYAYYRTQANIEGARASAASAAIPFTLLGTAFNAAAEVPSIAGSSLIGGARATPAAPGYIPIPRRRPTLGPVG